MRIERDRQHRVITDEGSQFDEPDHCEQCVHCKQRSVLTRGNGAIDCAAIML